MWSSFSVRFYSGPSQSIKPCSFSLSLSLTPPLRLPADLRGRHGCLHRLCLHAAAHHGHPALLRGYPVTHWTHPSVCDLLSVGQPAIPAWFRTVSWTPGRDWCWPCQGGSSLLFSKAVSISKYVLKVMLDEVVPSDCFSSKEFKILTDVDTEVGWRCTWFPLIFLSPLIKHTSLLTKCVNYVAVRLCFVSRNDFIVFYCKKTVNYCGNCLMVCNKAKKRMFAGSHLWLSQGTIFIFAIVFSKVSNLCPKTKNLMVATITNVFVFNTFVITLCNNK